MKKEISYFLKKAREMPDFDRVKFIILFGSVSQNKNNKFSDIDFAVYYEGNAKERFNFRLKLLANLSDKFDVQIYQDMPVSLRMESLKGKLLYSKDNAFTGDVAYTTIKIFEGFRKYYEDYISQRKIRIW